MHYLINVIRKEKALHVDNPKAFQYLKYHHANPTCFQVLQRQSLRPPTVCVFLFLLRLHNCYCFLMGDHTFLCSSVPCLGFLCKYSSCQLLGVCDVGAPGHHTAHQLRGEDVAQVDVHFLPHVLVPAVCRGFWVLRHVGGRSVGGHCQVSAVRRVRRERSAGWVRRVRRVGWRRWVV